jgi:hypothetical protein
VALDEMTTHAGIRRNCTFEIDVGAGCQGAEIRTSKSLWRNTDLEPGLVELGDCEAGSCRSNEY